MLSFCVFVCVFLVCYIIVYSLAYIISARIYHQVLQLIDVKDYTNSNASSNANTHTQLHPQELKLYPVSVTMDILQLSSILDSVKRDVLQYFDYDHDLHPLVHRFFKLLRKRLDKSIARLKQKETTKHKKRKQASISPSSSTTTLQPATKRRRIDPADEENVHFGPYTRKHTLRDDEAKKREDSGELRFCLLYNDSTWLSWSKLIDLKEVFHECLPQMPTQYITRIIMDKRHRSIIATMNHNANHNHNNSDSSMSSIATSTHSGMPVEPKGVFGGVCFRPFPERNFAEVVFLAISQNHQIKGFGTRLMNHLKETLKKMGIYHIITFADNNAIDYFAKQGFELRLDVIDEAGNVVPSKPPITNTEHKDDDNDDDEENEAEQQRRKKQKEEEEEAAEIDRLYGCKNLDFDQIIRGDQKYIKIYNDATLMHCRIIKRINYCDLNRHLIANRKAMVEKIAAISHSVQKRDGLQDFQNSAVYRKQRRNQSLSKSDFHVKVSEIPGVHIGDGEESKVSSNLFLTQQPTEMVEVTAKISGILKQLYCHCKGSVFAKPVDRAQAPLYYDVIKNPMDLSKIQEKLNNYKYSSMTQFINDFKLIITNCKIFNPRDNIYHTHALEFDRYFDQLLKQNNVQ